MFSPVPQIHKSNFNPRTYTRCDSYKILLKNRLTDFNPRTYTRCDITKVLSHIFHRISIHAPTRGAISLLWIRLPSSSFQSTHLHEVRCQRPLEQRLSCHFNPRTYTRCDRCVDVEQCHRIISIHAPTRGAMCTADPCTQAHIISIHAPTRGAIDAFSSGADIDFISIHAPTRGAMPLRLAELAIDVISIHAPTRGAMTVENLSSVSISFQSTHLNEVRSRKSLWMPSH